ncbi:MAG: MSMEG_4193 family putative phosphomutase [Acidimicrobiaceae bacterium]|nr:MSMEG_4193 family putative phosphomutase [Acidimicrobiaceae bacterium]
MATSSARASAKPASKAGTEAAAVVLFVRHGQTPTTGSVLPGRAPGLHLSSEGVEQAQRVAERLAELGRIKAIYASPMERTVETAGPIARACKLRVRRSPGLIECDFGRWTGRKLQSLRRRKDWTTVQRHPSGFRFPGGESFAEMQARALDTVAAICARHAGETVVAVSHADVIKAVAASAAGTPLDLFQRIVISPCSVTAIAYHPSGPILLTVNNTGDDLASLRPS